MLRCFSCPRVQHTTGLQEICLSKEYNVLCQASLCRQYTAIINGCRTAGWQMLAHPAFLRLCRLLGQEMGTRTMIWRYSKTNVINAPFPLCPISLLNTYTHYPEIFTTWQQAGLSSQTGQSYACLLRSTLSLQ